MNQKIDRILNRISMRTIRNMLVALYAISIIPLLFVAFYNYPSADDFSMTKTVRHAFVEHGFGAAILDAAASAFRQWKTWIGYFSSSFLTDLCPSIFDERLYFLGTWIVIAGLTLGTVYFLNALLHRAMKVSRDIVICVTMLTLGISIQGMPGSGARVESLFWYAGAINYTFAYGMALLYIGLLISSVCAETSKIRARSFVFATLLSFFMGGVNYMTALTIAMISVFGLVAGKIRHKNVKQLCLPVVLFFAGFAVSAAAPGNRLRGNITGGFGPVKSILISLFYTLRYCVTEWTDWTLIAVLFLLVPFLWKAAGQAQYSFRLPGLYSLFGMGIVSANITPPIYAQGNILGGRIQGLFWLQYVLALVLLEFYWIGWFRKHIDVSFMLPARRMSMHILVTMTVLLIAGASMSIGTNADYYASSSAMQDIWNGSAKSYHEASLKRRDVLLNPNIADVVLDSYEITPDLLFYSDVEMETDSWKNTAMAYYYYKNSVRRQ